MASQHGLGLPVLVPDALSKTDIRIIRDMLQYSPEFNQHRLWALVNGINNCPARPADRAHIANLLRQAIFWQYEFKEQDVLRRESNRN